MKKVHLPILLLLAALLLFTSCAPKIYGQTKKKKSKGRRNCGCSLVIPDAGSEMCFYELKSE